MFAKASLHIVVVVSLLPAPEGESQACKAATPRSGIQIMQDD